MKSINKYDTKMNKEFLKMNQTQIIAGFNTVAMVVMLIWVIRTNLEFKNNLEEIRKQISDMKQNNNDNTKRSTLSLSRLSQRLEDLSMKVNNVSSITQSLTSGTQPPIAPAPLINTTSVNPEYENNALFNMQSYNPNPTMGGRQEIDDAVRALMQ